MVLCVNYEHKEHKKSVALLNYYIEISCGPVCSTCKITECLYIKGLVNIHGNTGPGNENSTVLKLSLALVMLPAQIMHGPVIKSVSWLINAF